MRDIPAATAHYRGVLALQAEAQRQARIAWGQVNPSMIRASWQAAAPSLTARLRGLQRRAATSGATYGAAVLADTSRTYIPPSGFADVDAYVGWMVDDDDPVWQVPLGAAVESATVRPLSLIGRGWEPRAALAAGGQALDATVLTAVADAARQAASVDLLARPGTGYVRMLNPPSCDRCVVLAGRWYRWNTGFQRHPHCDCTHVAATVGALRGAEQEGLLTDPYAYFKGLTEADQDRIFTRAGAQAIRDGADIYQVVNSRRGMSAASRRRRLAASDPRRRWTTEGTTRRGIAYQMGVRGRRLTPEGIYSQAKTRDEAVRLLTEQGYILPAGQIPGGSIYGPVRQGFGQMGRGGARKAATQAVLDAIATGQRDLSNVYTMTAAERRIHDARRDWQLAASGIDPTSPGAVELRGGARIGGTLRPATPEMAAQYERAYRLLLANQGRRQ